MKFKIFAIMALVSLGLYGAWHFSKEKQSQIKNVDKELAVFKIPTGGDFTIKSTTGEFNTKDQRGKVTFVFFGFTHCPHICPLTLSNMDRMFKNLPPNVRDKVQSIFISIDPERDTMEVIQKRLSYLSSKKNFIGATDTEENLRKITKLFGARFSKIKSESGNIFVDHTSQVFVINSRGEWVNTLGFNVPPSEFKQAFETADDSKPVLSRIHPLKDTPLIDKNLTCDLAKSKMCAIEKDGKKIELSLMPQPVREGQEIEVKVVSTYTDWKPILVDFDGVEEDMGYIRPQLKLQSENLFETKFELPICELKGMQWNVRVILQNSIGETQAFGFYMKTNR